MSELRGFSGLIVLVLPVCVDLDGKPVVGQVVVLSLGCCWVCFLALGLAVFDVCSWLGNALSLFVYGCY